MKRGYANRHATPTMGPVTAATDRRIAASMRSPAGMPRYLGASPTTKPDLNRQPQVVREILQQPGQPLDVVTRRTMERRFGRDLSDVRVHTSIDAAHSAAALQAEAYTLGSHIVFGGGRFAPNSADGRRLLAHELTHVAQQTQSGSTRGTPEALEAQAERNSAESFPSRSSASITAGPVGLQRKPINPGQTSAPAASDHLVVDLGGPNWWYVFYDQSFKVVKKIFAESATKPGVKEDTRQIGPNWVCNNPGNLTYDPAKIGDAGNANIAVLSKICREHGAFPAPFALITNMSFAIFPTMEKGREALMAWFSALLTPDHPYWKEIGSKRTARSIVGAVTEHAPQGHGGNSPQKYAAMVAENINRERALANTALQSVPFGSLFQRGKIDANKTASVSAGGMGNQDIDAMDLQAWARASEKAEGGTVAGFTWEVASGNALPADLAKKIGQTGGAPAALLAWCAAHNVRLPPEALTKKN